MTDYFREWQKAHDRICQLLERNRYLELKLAAYERKEQEEKEEFDQLMDAVEAELLTPEVLEAIQKV